MKQRTYPLDPQSLIVEPMVPVTVTPIALDQVQLKWGSCDEVVVHATTTPDFSPNQIAQGITSSLAVKDPFPNQRTYFHLQFSSGRCITVAERFIPLEGVANFRDIGGYLTADKTHMVRWGQLYRSGHLANLTQADQETLQDLGIQLVCDFRTTEETVDKPDKLLFPHTYHHAHIRNNSGWQRIKSTAIALFWRQALPNAFLDVYTQVTIENNSDVLRDAFLQMMNDEMLPAVIHCVAGKDRTGIMTALLLELLGIPRQTVLAEYSLSNYFYETFATSIQKQIQPVTRYGLTTDKLQPLLLADPMILAATLDYIDLHYESVEHYICNKVGLSPAQIHLLRTHFLTPVKILSTS